MSSDPLGAFLPAVRAWFRETYGTPTPPQAQGWPPIQRGEHTLIFAPTGSGKTLSAFLWGIDAILREQTSSEPPPDGVRLLYVSPLKALNNDIERNLRAPLEGIRDRLERETGNTPVLRVAVRTGDTPAPARRQMLKHPPHILITTPESLYLILTSSKAHEMLRSVRTVILDEIHALIDDKRGTHLLLSLERLQQLAGNDFQRIGLSATIRPLEEGARFLGGQAWQDGQLIPRPVTIVHAAYHKPLALEVVTAVPDLSAIEGGTIWPHVVPRVLADVMSHRTTLIFANNRRLAERTADRLNAQFSAVQQEDADPLTPHLLAPDGVPREAGMFAIGAEGPFRAHHGSMSREARHQMEADLKAGRLPALIGTSSLELGIDIGEIDLVVQLQSPKSVAQGLQRVGRSGHRVGQTSAGRIYATFGEDLVESAALVRGMLDGDVETTSAPQNPLDILAQQIVAMVAVEPWDADALFDLVRQAYPYQDLPRASYDLVLGMLSGAYHDTTGPHGGALRARMVWDRHQKRLNALPGARLLAISNAGTIGDRGAFGVYLGDGKTKLGELDEEFVYETRPGNTFLLGSQVWRVLEIRDDRMIVGEAAGATPRMPFWRGDYPWRSFALGARIGAFKRDLLERLERGEDVVEWLQREHRLDDSSATNLIAYVRGMRDAAGAVSTDRRLVAESFRDALGTRVTVIHSPFGGRVNGAWALALSSLLRERLGVEVETQVNDDGILLRLPGTGETLPPEALAPSAAVARERIVRELPGSALFGAHFRVNAERALLLPRARGGKRTAFWLQRLKAKDLLALVGRFDDFPIVVETYRDCLRDVLDMRDLERVLTAIGSGEIEIVPVETLVPSPVAAGLLFAFQAIYQYEWDEPKAERDLRALSVRGDVLADLLSQRDSDLRDLLKPVAVAVTRDQAQHVEPGTRARTVDELSLFLFELGDLTTTEVIERCTGDALDWLAQLEQDGRIGRLRFADGGERWVHAERAPEYRAAFEGSDEARLAIVRRFIAHGGAVTRDAIVARYAFPAEWLDAALARMADAGDIRRGHFSAGVSAEEFVTPAGLESMHQRTLTILRREVQAVPFSTYAHFVARWQRAHPNTRRAGEDAVAEAVRQLRGFPAPGIVWEDELLAARVAGSVADALADEIESGNSYWIMEGREPARARVRFVGRGEGVILLRPPDETTLSDTTRQVLDYLRNEGVSSVEDIQVGVPLPIGVLVAALVELALASLVSGDTLDGLRAVLAYAPEREARAPLSALEAELAERRVTLLRISPGRIRDARRRARRRVEVETSGIPTLPGGWFAVTRLALMGKAPTAEGHADALARLLLERYGVVARETLANEDLPLDWMALYARLQRMEMRGEVRRGYFVDGLSGAQFALPAAVEQLRASAANDEALIVLNATDPANLAGQNARRLSRLPSSHVVLRGGIPILFAEDHGERITVATDAPEETARAALQAYLAQANLPRRLSVRKWNDGDVRGTPAESWLRALGFSAGPAGMER